MGINIKRSEDPSDALCPCSPGHFKGSGTDRLRSGPEALRERGLKNETAGLAAESEENAIIPGIIPGGRRRVVSVPSWASDPVGTLEAGFDALSSTADKAACPKSPSQ